MASKQVSFSQVLMIALATTIVSALLSWVFMAGRLAALEKAIQRLEEIIRSDPKERPITIAGGSVDLGFDDGTYVKNSSSNEWVASGVKIERLDVIDEDKSGDEVVYSFDSLSSKAFSIEIKTKHKDDGTVKVMYKAPGVTLAVDKLDLVKRLGGFSNRLRSRKTATIESITIKDTSNEYLPCKKDNVSITKCDLSGVKGKIILQIDARLP